MAYFWQVFGCCVARVVSKSVLDTLGSQRGLSICVFCEELPDDRLNTNANCFPAIGDIKTCTDEPWREFTAIPCVVHVQTLPSCRESISIFDGEAIEYGKRRLPPRYP